MRVLSKKANRRISLKCQNNPSYTVCGICTNNNVCVCYLCPRDGSKGIGGSQDRLVVHDRLRGHHGNAPHLMTHLRRELVGGQVSAGGDQGEGGE